MYIPGDEHSVDMDERLGNYDGSGRWIGNPPQSYPEPPYEEPTYWDGDPKEAKQLKVGDRVNVWIDTNPDSEGLPPGTIIQIDEQEGDVDDEGRSYAIGPYVVVQWDDEDQPERFKGYTGGLLNGKFIFDDLMRLDKDA